MKFNNDEPVECEACNKYIYAPDSYLTIKRNNVKHVCCNDEECMMNLLMMLYEGDFKEVRLYTAEEHSDIYGDMEYDRIKDEII